MWIKDDSHLQGYPIFDAGHFPPAGKFAHVVVDANVSSCWRPEGEDYRETAASGGQKTQYAAFGRRRLTNKTKKAHERYC